MDNGHIRKRNNGGFTLLELMIVIVILGILGAIVAPKFMDEPHKARVVQAKMQIEKPVHGGQKFYLDNGFYRPRNRASKRSSPVRPSARRPRTTRPTATSPRSRRTPGATITSTRRPGRKCRLKS